MGSIPLPALSVRPPVQPENPMDQYAKALQVKGMMQQQQMGQVQLQQAQQAQKDQKTLGELMVKNNGNLDKVIQDAPQAGVMPNTILQLQAHALDVKTKQQAFTADQLKNFAAVHDNAAGLIQPVLDAKTPEQKDAAYQAGLQQIQANPTMYGITDPSQMPPPQRPPDDALKVQLSVHMGQKEQAAQQFKERATAAEELAAQARKIAADATAGKSGPLAPPVIPQLNNGLAARWNVLNPGQPPPEWAQIGPGAKKEDFDRADKLLQQVEQAQAVKAQQDLARSTKAAASGTARGDKSYQFNSGQLEKVAQPVDQAISRMGRLQDALAQNTPQADALIAPELLSVMAGGAGSGLRMNEAEIGRIVGGRSKWETLKASINQWSLDPSKANSITPEQRKEIRSLVSEVDTKLKAKQAALDEARQGLLATDDPGEHRKIVAKARSKMTEVDQGAGQTSSNSGMISVQIPGHPPGKIPASAKAQFMKDHPDATFQ